MNGQTARRGLTRKRATVGLALAALLMLPPAIALACNPQAHINLNQASYSPGATMTVYGSYFPGNVSISLSGPAGGTTATTSAGGAFVTTLAAPSAAGDYVVSAGKPTGGSAVASFAVVAPVAAPAPVKTPAFHTPTVSSSHAGKSQSVPATRIAQHASSGAGRFTSSHHVSKPTTPVPTTAPTTAPVAPSTPAPAIAATSAPSTVASTPVATRTTSTKSHARHRHSTAAPAATAKPTATAPKPSAVAATSPLAASSDLWSGFAPGQQASLVSGTPGPMNGGGTSSALTIGIALLALGMVGLVSGLAVAEVRRRRRTVG